MKLNFPDYFLWGTSTAATQIETASDHNWRGTTASDDFVLERTTDHELRREEDLDYITQLGSLYRCSVDWARLQAAPFAPFDQEVVAEYQHFFEQLNEAGVRILLVVHHFTHPRWFEENEGWLNEDNLSAFVDYARQCVEHFGLYVWIWNTFNEPNVYARQAYVLGNFPPFKKKKPGKARKTLRMMAMAHEAVYKLIKAKYPGRQVGVSLNAARFAVKKKGIGRVIPKRRSYKAARRFEAVDFWGLSCYTYALPESDRWLLIKNKRFGKKSKPGKVYGNAGVCRPKDLEKILRRFHKRFKKPLIIADHGICTDKPEERILSIKEYLKVCHSAIQKGVDLRAYIHRNAWDSFEWHLGPSYRFGLVRVNNFTKDREWTKAAEFYKQTAMENAVEV